MSTYLNTLYSTKVRPVTAYPDKLANYLVKRLDLNQNMKLLDLGCGRGDMLQAFKNHGLKVQGGDIEYLENPLLKEIEIKTFDLTKDKYPYEDNTFDVIFSKSVIEHMENPEHFLKEQKRILKEDGLIIILTPDWYSQMKIFYNDFTHRRPYNATSLNYALQTYGFEEIHTELFYQLPIVWKYPFLKKLFYPLRLLGPVRMIHKNKLYRFLRELMVLGLARK